MGYSISVRLPTQALRDYALDFIQKDMEQHPHSYNLKPLRGNELGYRPSGNMDRVIGFHSMLLGDFPWFACAWLAHKAGSQKNGIWHLYYDDQYTPVYESCSGRDAGTHANGVVVDPNGIMDVSGHSFIWRVMHAKEHRRLRKMLARWNQAWQPPSARLEKSTAL